MKYHLLSELVHRRAAELGSKEVIRSRNEKTGQWTGISWNAFSSRILKLAEVFVEWGIKEGDRVGIFSQNKEECLIFDFALFAIKGISVPMYATSSVSQIQYIVDESEIELLFVGEQFQYDNACQILSQGKTLKQLIIIDNDVVKASDDKTSVYLDEFVGQDTNASGEVQRRRNTVTEDDIVHVIYTSGTTGEPKGVVLKQSNYVEVMRLHDIRLSYLPKECISMCFLPLTHIFEKAWSIFCLHRGYTLAINLNPAEIQNTIKEVRPNAMCSVPRFWEKVYAGVQEKIETSKPFVRKIFLDAIKTGKEYVFNYRNEGKKAPSGLALKFWIYDKTIYSTLKKVIGIEKGVIYPCAGAPLSDNINTFILSVNIPLVYGYGLSETTATVSCFPPEKFTIGTVGKVMPEVEVKIGENNEILIKGKSIMHGYYKKPEETANAFTEDGWFRSGDAGYLTKNNEIVLTDRLKDLYKTSNGKYIAPQQIEIKLAEDKYIDMAAVIGDKRKYVTALIVPVYSELEAYAKETGIDYKDLADLCRNPKIYDLISQRISPLQQELANYEQIKKFAIIPAPFSIGSGELTNTLKLRRAFIAEKYKKEIQEMYQE